MDLHLAELSRTIDPVVLGRRIRTARVAAGMTQAQVAAEDITAAYLSRIEDGQRRPEAGLLERMATRMGVTLDDLLLDVTRDQRMELQLAVDYAELALASGDAEGALKAASNLVSDPAVESVPQLLRAAQRVKAGALENTGDLDGAIVLLEDLTSEPTPDVTWLKMLIALTRCYRDSGDFPRAIAVGDKAAKTIEDLGLEGLTEAIQLTVTVAAAQLWQGDTDQAMRTCMRALAAAEKHGSVLGKASAYWNASVVEARRGAVPSAIELARKALAMFELSDDNRNLANLRSQLANLHLQLDPPDPTTALEILNNMEQEMTWSGSGAWDISFMHVQRARANYLLGDFNEARASLARVAETKPDSAPLVEAQWHSLHGRVAFAEGDPEEARQHYRAAILVLSGVGVDRGAAQLWFELAELLTQAGDNEGAIQAFRSAGASTGFRVSTPTTISTHA
ncbi:helix-turn-helix domain-containing protein [Nocardioides sp. WS12]|uniref:helix-turn-helix domain-containing protein n=1 Tax=Nocardioides sp. WS12 TaxID=2486272 RepID=UPI0015FDE17F|nr:helix-turn-helix domain-containing protein [Nocardioides sp. WS12]